MNNFGVIELASTKTTNAPGWAYVPDTGPGSHLGAAALQSLPTNRKRARNAGAANLTYADVNARQEAKTRREIEILDRDNHRDVQIPVPAKPSSSSSSSKTQQPKKHTPNVRKILQSQKTFANHLDDFMASLNNPNPPPPASLASHNTHTSVSTLSTAISRKQPPTSRTSAATRAAVKQEETNDVQMTDAPESGGLDSATPDFNRRKPPPHASDNDPLLMSRVPSLPTDEELRALMSAPPLTYLEARADWSESDKRYPTRVFCEVCGYWGRVKCMRCGARVCALDCLETHREECVTRYGI